MIFLAVLADAAPAEQQEEIIFSKQMLSQSCLNAVFWNLK